MDVNIHALRAGRMVTPTVVTFTFYRKLCQQRGICWCCLKAYNDDHRARKANPAATPCPHPPVGAAQMDQFARICQTQPLPPPPVSQFGGSAPSILAVAAVSPLAHPFEGGPALLTPPASSYHTPPHLVYLPQPSFSYPQVHHPVVSYPLYPVHPPLHHYPVHAPPPAVPGTTPLLPATPVLGPVPAPVSPPGSLAAVSAVFSEYVDLDEPCFYDLPEGSLDDPLDGGFWSAPEESRASISAIEFQNPALVGARMILKVTLWAGKRAVSAWALIDSGSDGDFIDSSFSANHSLSLLKRKFPLNASGFNRAPAKSGPITHF